LFSVLLGAIILLLPWLVNT